MRVRAGLTLVVTALLWGSALVPGRIAILIGELAAGADSLRLAFVQYLTCGVIGTVLGLVLEHNTVQGWTASWWTVLYNGLVSIGVAFTLQIVA